MITDIEERDPNICNNIILEFMVDKNGIANISATTNPEYGEVTKYNIEIDFESKDVGTLSQDKLDEIRDKMKSWH